MHGVGVFPALDGVEEVGEETAICLGIYAECIDRCVEDAADLALFGCCSTMVPFG